MPDVTVALWGPASAGKTVFLAQLYLQPFSMKTDWDIFATEDSQRFLEQVQKEIDNNRFPPATTINDIQKVAYTFRHRVTGREAALIIEDRAGVESTNLTEESKKRLNEADGLLLLFDPEAEPRLLAHKIEETLRKLHIAAARGARSDQRPIAVCLSKCDLLIDTPEDLERARQNPREFVLEKITPDLVQWLGKYCADFELFPVSSVGIRLRHGAIERVVFYDEAFALRMGADGASINLMAPFEWLFNRIEERGSAS
jgi:GTPase SAR1 family protein